MDLSKARDGGIAIVGASALYPGSIGAPSFWSNILAGGDFMSDVPEDHWLIDDYYDPDPSKPGKIYARRGGFLPQVDFDPLEHGLPPRQLSTTDTAQLLALIVAQKVMEDASSIQFGKIDRKNISVILGVASATELVGQMAAKIQRPHWVTALREAGFPEAQVQEACDRIEATYPEWDESTFPGLLGNVVAGRIANRLDLGGTNCVVDAACASSLGAVAMAVQELRLGHSDLVITGGVDALNDVFMYMCFSKTPALSPTGDCRPFADSADGTMLGEGIGMVALRRLEDAERDGDKIYAVLRGIGSSSDGRAKSIYAPRSQGQEIAIRRAYERAGYGPGEVGLIEAHGTATKAGDLAEFEGLVSAFSDVEARQVCALGSVKSQIGHTKAAAGAASLFKVAMALHHKVLPPTIKVDRPNGKLDIANSPFYLNTECRPWIVPAGKTRKGSVSSFGFGGSNFHIALEEYVGDRAAAPRYASLSVHLLLLGADSAAGLVAAARDLQAQLGRRPLAAVARESQVAFAATSAHRLAVLAGDAEGAIAQLASAIGQVEKDGRTGLSIANRLHYGVGAERPKVAFLFPGQGSQYVNMGRELAVEFDVARRVWDDTASLGLDPERSLHEVVFPIPVFSEEERREQAARLTRTDWAQPAIGATSLSMLALLRQLGLEPDAVAGHSYGEVTALHVAGVIGTQADMITISRRRGELMAAAAGTGGAMMAVRAGAARIEALLAGKGLEKIVLANLNSPSQVVVAGPVENVESFRRVAEEAGLSCQPLPVATAFHTSFVSGCAEPFERFLSGLPLAPPRLPVYGNTEAAPYTSDPAAAAGLLAQQLARPVRFAEMIDRMHADGCRLFLEVGPGSVLTGLVGDCLAGRPHVAVALDQRKADGRAAFLNALGVLSANGVALDFAALWKGFAPVEEASDKARRGAATVKLGGANFGKPYPPKGGAAARPQPNPVQVMAAPTAATARVEATAVSPAFLAPAPAVLPVVPEFASSPAMTVPFEHDMPRFSQSDSAWAAFQSLQGNMLEAQKAFTQAMSDAHQAYLRASEAGFLQLSGQKPTAAVPSFAPFVAPPRPVAPSMPAEVPEPAAVTLGMPAMPESSRPEPALVSPTPVADSPDATALLLEVVSEKTGYPVEMLTLDMELEAGLGIDSIKRVQILSALQEKLPRLASVDTAELAALGTLGEIVAFAGKAGSDARGSGAQMGEEPTMPETPPVDATALLLEVVSEKTGYPVEMLTLDMELEAGLGIDSIKRVQILSALQEKLPRLASVDTAELAALGTLGEIVAFAGRPSEPGAAVGAPKPAEATPPPTLERLVVEAAPCTAPGLITPSLMDPGPLWIVGGPQRIATKLRDVLGQAGVPAQVVESMPADASRAVLLTGLGGTDRDAAAQTALNEAVFREVSSCAGTMADAGRLLVIVQATGGSLGLDGLSGELAWATGIGAIAKTAALEWPHATLRAIDVETAERSADAVATALGLELLTGGATLEVGLTADGQRVVPVAIERPVMPQSEAPELGDRVIVVTGGARGVTAACLAELLARRPRPVAILGRTALAEEAPDLAGLLTEADIKRSILQRHVRTEDAVTPQQLTAEARAVLAGRELRGNLERFRALGAEVRYHAVDVGDGDAVRRTLEIVRRDQGPIGAVVHAAGVLADKEIRHKTPAQVRQVLRTKVDGLRHLLEAMREDHLERIVCFSSASAWRGNAGQVDYAMANQILNRVCRAEQVRRGASCRVVAIGWGPWAGGMVDDGLAAHFASQGVPLIPLADGARAFADEVEGRHGRAAEILVGVGLASFGGARPQKGEAAEFLVRVHRDTHDYLASHVVGAGPLLPLVAANDMVLRAVSHWLGQEVAGTADLEVVNGLPIRDLDGAGDLVRIECQRHGQPDRIKVRILGADGRLGYRMDVLLGTPVLRNPDAAIPSTAWPLSKPIYDGRLFHGPALQVIEAIESLSEAGCVATLRSRDLSRPQDGSAPVDVLDGGLQLATLWSHEIDGRECLPTAARLIQLDRGWDPIEPVRCQAVCTSCGNLSSSWTLHYLDRSGRVLGLIEGLEMYVRAVRTAQLDTVS